MFQQKPEKLDQLFWNIIKADNQSKNFSIPLKKSADLRFQKESETTEEVQSYNQNDKANLPLTVKFVMTVFHLYLNKALPKALQVFLSVGSKPYPGLQAHL